MSGFAAKKCNVQLWTSTLTSKCLAENDVNINNMTLNDVALHVLLFDFFHPTGRLRVCKIRFASTSENHRKLCPILKRPVFLVFCGERGGSVVECRTPEREVLGSRPTAAVLCPWARHFTPRKYWLITQEAMAPSRHDWKIVDWDVKPQHNQHNQILVFCSFFCVESQSKGGKSQKSSKTQVQREETDDNGADILAREAKTIAER